MGTPLVMWRELLARKRAAVWIVMGTTAVLLLLYSYGGSDAKGAQTPALSTSFMWLDGVLVDRLRIMSAYRDGSWLNVVASPVAFPGGGLCMTCEFTSLNGAVTTASGFSTDLSLVRCPLPAAVDDLFALRVGFTSAAMSPLYYEGVSQPPPLPQVTMSLAAIIKNEPLALLLEWVLYCKVIGFERMALYDNSRTGEYAVLQQWFPELVFVVPWPQASSLPTALTDSIHRFGPRTAWLGWFDPDEYPVAMRFEAAGGQSVMRLFVPSQQELVAALKAAGRRGATTVPLEWRTMVPCAEVEVPRRALVSRCNRILPNSALNQHVKPFFTPQHYLSNSGYTPHAATPRPGAKAKSESVQFLLLHALLSRSEFLWRRRDTVDAIFKTAKGEAYFDAALLEASLDMGDGSSSVDGRDVLRFGLTIEDEVMRLPVAAQRIWSNVTIQ